MDPPVLNVRTSRGVIAVQHVVMGFKAPGVTPRLRSVTRDPWSRPTLLPRVSISCGTQGPIQTNRSGHWAGSAGDVAATLAEARHHRALSQGTGSALTEVASANPSAALGSRRSSRSPSTAASVGALDVRAELGSCEGTVYSGAVTIHAYPGPLRADCRSPGARPAWKPSCGIPSVSPMLLRITATGGRCAQRIETFGEPYGRTPKPSPVRPAIVMFIYRRGAGTTCCASADT
jgi:hypothetical protein